MVCQNIVAVIAQGTLASTCDTSRELGFLSFVQLIGTVYFKKHLSFNRTLYLIAFLVVIPSPSINNGLTTLRPPYGRILNL